MAESRPGKMELLKLEPAEIQFDMTQKEPTVILKVKNTYVRGRGGPHAGAGRRRMGWSSWGQGEAAV